MDWQPDAEQRLREIPFFVRPAVRRRIESLAAEAGLSAIDEAFYEQARARFGQK
ncbi:MAG: PCP reductase family protein [Cyanobacteriota bacterium]